METTPSISGFGSIMKYDVANAISSVKKKYDEDTGILLIITSHRKKVHLYKHNLVVWNIFSAKKIVRIYETKTKSAINAGYKIPT